MGSSGSPLAVGTMFGPYRIVAPLGSGGMSVLYRATDESLGRDVALKVMAPDLSEDPGFRARFTSEARLASHVDHPHIVPIYAFGEGAGDHAGRLYIAMRYVPGEDLRAALRRVGRLQPAGVLAALGPIAHALDAVHRAGLVHRDVKPDNILLQWDDRGGIHPYLADFGLTRTGSGSGLTRTGEMLGTLAYAAPEQIRGEGIGPATDVYALGAVLYECLTGVKPFPRDNEGAVIYAHLSDAVPSINASVPELPPGLDAIVARAMAKEPDGRYPTAGALLDDVRAAFGVPGTSDTTGTTAAEAIAATPGTGGPGGSGAIPTPGPGEAVDPDEAPTTATPTPVATIALAGADPGDAEVAGGVVGNVATGGATADAPGAPAGTGPGATDADVAGSGSGGADATAPGSHDDDPGRATTLVATRARRRGWWIAAAALVVVLVAASVAALTTRDAPLDAELADSHGPSTTQAGEGTELGGSGQGQTSTTVGPSGTTTPEGQPGQGNGQGETTTTATGTGGGGRDPGTGGSGQTPTNNNTGGGNDGGGGGNDPGKGPAPDPGPTSPPGPVQQATARYSRVSTSIFSAGCGGDPATMTVTVDVSWAAPAHTGGSIDGYVVRANLFNGAGTLLHRDAAVVSVGGGTTSASVTVPRSDHGDSYYAYDVVAGNARGAGSAVRAEVVVPSVTNLCSWTGWQVLRGVGIRPFVGTSTPDPNGSSDDRIFFQSINPGTVVPAGADMTWRNYVKPA